MGFTVAVITAEDTRMAEARRIRDVVFCQEQSVSPEEEWDGKDHLCEHYLLSDGEAVIGTARVRPYGPGIFKVERVAVLKENRTRGAGKAIMQAILDRLSTRKPNAVVLNAQCAVEEFYARLGFVSEGDVFEEANIAHIHMVWRP